MTKKLSLLRKEIIDFYRFFCKTPKGQKAIIFYAEHEGYYPNFEGLIEELINEYKQTLCYITSDSNDPSLQKMDSRIKVFYLNKLLPFFMVFVNCKVFVMTLTDLNQFHLKRSINPVHYVYIYHAMVSTHMVYRYGSFDHYDSILCVGPHHVKEIRKHEELNKLRPKKLVKAGYYRLERIYQSYQKYLQNKSLTSQKTILIAPSWGKDNILESCGEHLIEILLEAGYKIITRAHPETVKRFPNLIDSFVYKFGSNPNFTLEKSVRTDDSLLRADVLISDCSGVAYEYAFGTERPVLFIDVPAKVRNSRYKELGIEPMEISLRSEIGIIVSPKKLENIPRIISDLIAGEIDYKKRIIDLRKQYVYSFGNSSEVGAKYILNITKGSIEK